jgi:peptidoglycan/xylan/chitin deacetylase (PgdA/CDA1 family)
MIPILTYHRVLAKTLSNYDFTPVQLENQFRFLKSHGYQPITALQYVKYQKHSDLFPAKPVVLTFDDGHLSHYTKVFPLLKKYNFPATFFVCTSVISKQNSSKTQLTWSELSEMSKAGMDIESHTITHPYLDKSLPNEDYQSYIKRIDYEFVNSKSSLETRLHQKVDLLAYPYGWFNSVVETEAQKAGYKGLFTVNWGTNTLTDNFIRIKRRVMDNTMNLDSLKQILNTKPLAIDITTPLDTAILSKVPVIKFRLLNSNLKKAMIYVGSKKAILIPDKQGDYTYENVPAIKMGYHMITVKGYDSNQNLYIGSWGFDYQPSIKSYKSNKIL